MSDFGSRLDRALDARAGVAERTDAFRLVDGAADGFPGIEIDVYANRWMIQTRGEPPPPGLVDAALARGAASVYWKRLAAADRTAPVHLAGEVLHGTFEVRENGMGYRIDFDAGYSQGLFLDQRENRLRLREWCAGRPGVRVLNTFAYTCAFGVAAALGGADTVNLDLSRRSLEWGRDNYRLNRLDEAPTRFVAGDVFDWLGRFARSGRSFDAVVLDPPTFSRDRKGRVFRVAKDLPALVEAASGVLASEGVLLCSTNQSDLGPERFSSLVQAGLAKGGAFQPLPMPADFRGDRYLKTVWVGVGR